MAQKGKTQATRSGGFCPSLLVAREAAKPLYTSYHRNQQTVLPFSCTRRAISALETINRENELGGPSAATASMTLYKSTNAETQENEIKNRMVADCLLWNLVLETEILT